MRSALVALICAHCAWSATPPNEPEWDAVYRGDKHPFESTPKWSGNEGPNTSATVTPGGLRIVDAGTARTNLRCYGMGWRASPDVPGVAQATVKIVKCTDGSGMVVLVANGVNEDGLTLYPDRIELNHAGLAHRMDTTDGYHVYRVRIAGNDIQVWADGKLVIDGRGKFTKPAHRGRRHVGFGSISSASLGEGYWREVKVATMLPPAQELAGAKHVVIYKKEGVYACFPNFAKVDGNTLAVRFGTRVRRSHIDNKGGAATYLSTDGGDTWQPTDETFLPKRHWMPWGEYLTCGAGGWKYEPESKRAELEAKGLLVRNVRPGVIAHGGPPGFVRTSQDGKTWTQRTVPTPQYAHRQGYGPPGVMVTSKGVVMNAIYGKRTVEEAHSSLVMRSADRGQTWEWVTIAAADGSRLGFNETALFESHLGEVGALLRPSPEASNNTFISFSADHGKTWSEPKDAGFWGYPCDVLRLPDDRLVCTYGYRKGRMGIRSRISSDGGHTWGEEIVLRSDGWGRGGDMGYPRSALLPDGRIFTIYYINCRDNITHVAGTHWRAP